MRSKAVYAGTFDPLTVGHLDLIERAARIFDTLILAVAPSHGKTPMFPIEERLNMAKESVAHLSNVEVDAFEGLLVDYARERGVRVLIRGLRAFSDFEFEFQMALTNRRLSPDIETLFLMPKEEFSYVSSSTVREIADFGGDTSTFVPKPVQEALRRRFRK